MQNAILKYLRGYQYQKDTKTQSRIPEQGNHLTKDKK